MRVLADEQFNELTERIKQLEAENEYLKKLLDDAGISYDNADKDPKKNEPQAINIKEEPITRERRYAVCIGEFNLLYVQAAAYRGDRTHCPRQKQKACRRSSCALSDTDG